MRTLAQAVALLAPLVMPVGANSQAFSKTPLMKYLPNGTSMVNVKVPSYDEFQQPSSLFTADEMVVTDKEKGIIHATNAHIEIYSEEAPYHISLEQAYYNYFRSYLTTDSPVSIQNDSTAMVGSGAFYDMNTKELFLKGPSALCMLNKNSGQKGIALASLMAILPASSHDIPHTHSEEEQVVIENAEYVEEKSAKLEARLDKSDAKVAALLNKAGVTTIQESTAPDTNPAPLPEDALIVTNEGGTYYDADKGEIVVLKNVVLDEPRFHLTCDDQMKVFMKSGASPEGGQDTMTSSDVSHIVAEGNVVITYKSTDGTTPPMVARSEQAYFYVSKEVVILKGGFPQIEQGEQVMKALDPGMTVTIKRNGFVWSAGRKQTIYKVEK